jgi:uncharacterized protein (TIGR00255 family)
MTQSMTGFGSAEASEDGLTVSVEIKSVNNRFIDIRFKMPSLFNSIEMDLRSKLKSKFKRGSFEMFVNYKKVDDTKTGFDDIDLSKVEAYLEKVLPALKGKGADVKVDPSLFLRQDFISEDNTKRDELLRKLLVGAADKAFDSLENSRTAEGSKLEEVLANHRAEYEKLFNVIVAKAQTFQGLIEERLRKKFKEFSADLDIDEPRFMQEVIYYLEKMDIDEEINRIKTHLAKLDELIAAKNETGRQIDFLLQELGRETNTIGSKSQISEVSELVVQMKAQLEKMREQNLNIE